MDGTATRRLRLVVAYDGGPFSGFARQPGRCTVQGELERTLSELAGAPVETVCAGRTDAGVHARGQVVHADLPGRLDPERVRRVLNAVAGPAIVVRQAAWAPEGFDARFSARRRTYVYRIDDSGGPDPLTRGYVLAWPRPLDLERMRSAAAPLVGEHDFAAFCRQRPGSSTRCRLRSIGVRRDPDGTAGVLAGRDRSKVGDVAPPHGLVLESVGYPSVAREATEVDRKRR